jgi:hypothetical protein
LYELSSLLAQLPIRCVYLPLCTSITKHSEKPCSFVIQLFAKKSENTALETWNLLPAFSNSW